MTVSCKREGGGVSAAGGAGRGGAGGERGGRERSPPDTHPPLSGGTGKRPNGVSQPLLRGARAAKRNAVFRQCDRERAPPAPLLRPAALCGSAGRPPSVNRRPWGPRDDGEAGRRGRASVSASPAPSGGAVLAASSPAGRRGPWALRQAGRSGLVGAGQG